MKLYIRDGEDKEINSIEELDLIRLLELEKAFNDFKNDLIENIRLRTKQENARRKQEYMRDYYRDYQRKVKNRKQKLKQKMMLQEMENFITSE